jgi:hypothetical protein
MKCPKCGSENIIPNKIGIGKVFKMFFWFILSIIVGIFFWPVWILSAVLFGVVILAMAANIKGQASKAVTQWECKRCKTIFNAAPIDQISSQ